MRGVGPARQINIVSIVLKVTKAVELFMDENEQHACMNLPTLREALAGMPSGLLVGNNAEVVSSLLIRSWDEIEVHWSKILPLTN